MRRGHRDAEHGVGAEAAEIGRAVQLDEPAIQRLLIGVLSGERRGNLAVHVADGLAHALAAVALRVGVAEFERLARAGGRARRDGRTTPRAGFEDDVDFNRGVAARVENLAGFEAANLHAGRDDITRVLLRWPRHSRGCMPRHIPVLVRATAIAAIALSPDFATAQSAGLGRPVTTQASAGAGRVLGVVRDDAGHAIGGASIIAVGTTSAMARSDERGRYSLALMPGEYILRASHERYISTYREPVRVQTSARLERHITLVRPGIQSGPPVMTAAMAKAGAVAQTPGDPDRDHSHSDAAWRLRHLPRSVLRDGSTSGEAAAESSNPARASAGGSVFDRAVLGSARRATSFFADTDFNGQVDFLTTSVRSGPSGWMPEQWPRGVAYVAVGAQAGALGDWRMRGAVSAGDGRVPAWVLLGEFLARDDAAHAFRVGVSYSAQGVDPRSSRPGLAAPTGARHVAGIYGSDRWRVWPGVVLDYGLRLDRYDYLEQPGLVSPMVGGRVSVLPRTTLVARASRRRLAPGADEFLPPPASGPWLPPDRTFSPLVGRAPIRAEDARHYEVGVEYALGAADRPHAVSVRRFRQAVLDQGATLFGVDATRGLGHYYVATPGSVVLDGWVLGARGRWRQRVHASVDYTMAVADWQAHRQARWIQRVAPSVVRANRERVHDVMTSIDAEIPETRTRVTLVLRANSAFSRADGRSAPVADGRFDVEIHQALPYQPIHGGRLELLFAVRTLFRDGRDMASFYDEVLTVAPPLRLVGGFQIRF